MDDRDPVRILHVDDDPDVLELVSAYFESEIPEFDVVAETDPENVAGVLEDGSFRCVVSDYDMPGMDGLELLDEVRERHSTLPFVLFTGKGSEAVASEAISRGVTDYVEKGGPEQIELLVNTVNNSVEMMQARTNYREIFQKVTDGITVHEVETWEIVDVNRQFCDMVGHSREDLIGETVGKFTAEEDGYPYEEARRRLEQAYEEGSATFEWVDETADGKPLPVEVHLRRARIGGVPRVLAIVRDVSDRVERREKLEEATSQLEAATKAGGVGTWQWYVDEDELYASEEFARTFGVDPEEAAEGTSVEAFFDGIHDDDLEEVRTRIEGAIESCGDYEAEYRVRGADGELRWVEAKGHVECDEEGEALRFPGALVDVTEHKLREIDLERYEKVVEASGDVMYAVDREGRITFVNDAAVRVTGYEKDELVGEHVSVITDEEYVEMGNDLVRELLSNDSMGRHGAYEMDLVTRDGERIQCENHLTLLPTEDGSYAGSVGVLRDITERKIREYELRRKQRQFDAVFQDPHKLVGLLDEEGNVVQANERAMEFVDEELDELRGLPFWETPWWTEELRDDVESWVDRAIDGEYVSYDADLVNSEGEGYSVQGTIRPVEGDDGGVDSLIVSAQDVTEREERKRELERYETLVETMPMGLFVLDENATIVDENEISAEMIGAPSGGYVGTPFPELVQDGRVDPSVMEKYVEAIRDLLSSETDTTKRVLETEIYPDDGPRRIINSHISLLPFEDEFRGTVHVYHDVTERKRRERELERQNERLDEFASVVSHDLRNPLAVARGNLELTLEEDGVDRLAQVSDALDRMDDLIGDLLELARQGRTVEDTDDVELGVVVDSAWSNVETEGSDMEVDLDRAVIDADESRLLQVLENLFRNAVEHGGDDVRVGLIRDDEGTEGFYVEDDGPGVPEDDRDTVFDYGYSTGGSGLGLAIVKDIAEAHGWSVRVTDGSLGGARFEVTDVEFVD